MQVVTFTNSRGQTITLKGSAPFLLSGIDGLGDVDADIQMQRSPFQDGGTYTDSILQTRPLSLEVAIISEDGPVGVSQKRSEIAQIFNPKLGLGRLTYENENGVIEIMAVPEHVPAFPRGSENRGYTFQKCIIDLIAPDPYWKSIDNLDQSLTAWIGKFEFPVEFPVQFGERADRATIINVGDEKTPVIIEFTGPATNPIVTNETTGESIKVNRVINSGDVLEVNTAFGNKTVEIISPNGSRTNVFNYIDLDSEFFQLIPGENVVSFSSDDADKAGSVSIQYKNRYLGV